MNTVMLNGNLGQDGVLRYTKDGKPVLNLSIATTKVRGEEKFTSWHKVVVFGKKAEWVAPAAKKGTEVSVIGELSYNTWEKDGVKRTDAQVIAYSCTVAAQRPSTYHEDAGPPASTPEDNFVGF